MESVFETVSHFQVKGKVVSIEAFGGGHINSTWKVTTTASVYLLQKINEKVFPLVENIVANRMLLNSIAKPSILVQEVLTSEGKNAFFDSKGVYRMQLFVEQAYAPAYIESLNEAFEAAFGFGELLNQTQTLQPSAFKEVIPSFHDLSLRLDQLEVAIKNDSVARLNEVQELVNQVSDFTWINDKMKSLWISGLPTRVCHNDTKIDNILLDKKTLSFQHVIDLDTVGPGTMLYDFGDLMRTCISPTKESEKDLNQVVFRDEIYEVLYQGFMKSVALFIQPIEKENLFFGGMYMTYIMAVRFLTDYLCGDSYYKISFKEENFVRAKNQLYLLELMSQKQPSIKG